MSGETFLNGIVGKPLGGMGSSRTSLGELTAPMDPKLVGEGLLPLPKYPPHCRHLASIALVRHPPQQSSFPVLRGLEKILVEHDSGPG